jgi:hypothetical protein
MFNPEIPSRDPKMGVGVLGLEQFWFNSRNRDDHVHGDTVAQSRLMSMCHLFSQQAVARKTSRERASPEAVCRRHGVDGNLS